MAEIIIVDSYTRQVDSREISLEKLLLRRVARRRRVAKRMAIRCPLLAVEFMQEEFPGYTYEEWEADVSRKTKRGKRFRRPKPKRFDWELIRKEIPDFFTVCVKRTPTSAVLHGKLKDGNKFTCIVRSSWFDGQRQCRFDAYDLIKLWQGPLKSFCQHPAVLLYEHNNKLPL